MQLNPVLSFEVLETGNPQSILVADTSIWGALEPKPATMEVTPAGYSNPIVFNIVKNTTIAINSAILNIGCDTGCEVQTLLDLDDGMYCIVIVGTPNAFRFSRNYLKTDTIRLNLDRKYVEAELLCGCPTSRYIKELNTVDFLIKSAEANNKLGLQKKAQALLFKAQEMIEEITIENCN